MLYDKTTVKQAPRETRAKESFLFDGDEQVGMSLVMGGWLHHDAADPNTHSSIHTSILPCIYPSIPNFIGATIYN